MSRVIDDRLRQILACPEKRHAWALYQLRIRGLSVAELSRQAGVNRSAVYAAWQRRYPRMQAIIAAAIDMRPQDLFPERYDADGLPIKWLGGKRLPVAPSGNNTTRTKRRNGSRKTKNDQQSEAQAA